MKKVIISLLGLVCMASVAAAASQPPTLEIGAKAPDFKLKGVDGKTYTLENFAGAKILAVIFTANHCPTAIAYEERIKKLVADYKDKGVAVVAIGSNDPKALRLNEMGYTDVGDTLEDMKIRAKQQKFNFPYLYDGDTQEVGKKYGPKATPHVFLFDAERRLRYAGRIDNSETGRDVEPRYVRNALDAMLAGKPVPVETTSARGCSIKWSDKRQSVVDYMKKLAEEPVSIEKVDLEGIKALRKNDTQKNRLITVWATWCGSCTAEFDEFVTMNRMYRHRAFELVTIDIDAPDASSEVLPFLKREQASNKNVQYDSKDHEALVKALDPEWSGAVPFTMLLAPGGKVLYKLEGEIHPLEVRRAIVKALGPRG